MNYRGDVDGVDLPKIADAMAGAGQGSHMDQVAKAEFLLRQTQFLERQANAAEETALATKRYTKYMLWSVLVLAVSSLVTLLVTLVR
jgi:hypothetical protein